MLALVRLVAALDCELVGPALGRVREESI